MKNIRVFYLKFFSFLVVKFSIYLNRRVFVMKSTEMTKGSMETNRVRNIHTIVCGTGSGKLQYQNQSHPVSHKIQKRLNH